MKSAKTHVVASTVLCALTLAVTLAARDALPEQAFRYASNIDDVRQRAAAMAAADQN